MSYTRIQHEVMNRNDKKYAELGFQCHRCPDCGRDYEHGLYTQSFLPKLNLVMIIEDCIACGNTRKVKTFRDGIEQGLRK